MIHLFNKIARSAILGYYFVANQKKYAHSDYQYPQQFSSQCSSIDQLLLEFAQAEKDSNVESLFEVYALLGKNFKQLNEFQQLIEYYKRALKIGALRYGEQSQEVAKILTNLAYAYINTNDIEKAEEALHKASKYMNQYDTNEYLAAAAYYKLCELVASIKNDTQKEIETYAKSREITEKFSGKFTIEISKIDEFVGNEYLKINLLEKAIQSYESAINIRNRLNAIDLELFSKLIILYKDMKYDKQANKTIKKAIRIIQNTNGRSSVALVDFYFGLGNIFQIKNDIANTKKYYAKTLNVLESIPDQYTHEASVFYEKLLIQFLKVEECEKFISCAGKLLSIKPYLGIEYDELNDYQKAQGYLQKAEDLVKKSNSEKVIQALCTAILAFYYRTQHKHAESIECFNRGIELNREILGKNHSDIAEIYMELGKTYELWGNLENTIKCFREAIEIYDQVKGLFNSNSANLHIQIGEIYDRVGEYEKSIEEHKKAIKILKEIPGDKDLGLAYYALANIYQRMKKWDKAKDSYEKGIKSNLARLGDEDPGPSMGYLFQGQMYEAKGDIATAIESYKKAMHFFMRLPNDDPLLINLKAKIEELLNECNN